MNIQKILDYQNKDFEIIKLERQLSDSTDKKMLTSISALVKESQKASQFLEKEAEEAVLQFNSLKKNYNDAISNLETSDKKTTKNIDNEGENLINDLNNISSNLANMEKRLMSLAEKINSILSDFDNAKKRYNTAKQKYSLHKGRLENLQNELSPQINFLIAELKTLETGIDKTLLAKYKTKRQDKVFPIIVPVRDNSCGGCMMELPSAQIDKLKRDGFLECENCHRIIYFN